MSDIDTIVGRLRHCSENCGDEYLRELTGKAADTIDRLTAEVDWHKENSARCQDTQAALLWEITHLTAERNKLRAALLVARKYVLVQSCELSLMPEDAARDLDVIDEALEENDD
jgi:hypothetical protein